MNALDQAIGTAALTALASGGTFLHESQAQATLSLNHTATLPVIVYGTATTAQARASSRVETATATVYFADATPGPGDDAAAARATQERMQQLKRRFLAALDAGPLVQVEGIRATPMVSVYEAVLDGVGVQFTLSVPVDLYCPPATSPAPVITRLAVVAV